MRAANVAMQVLKAKGAPMGVAEILEGVRANGYKYPSVNPKKNLGARIYRLLSRALKMQHGTAWQRFQSHNFQG